MRKRITAVILAIVVITVTTYCKPIKAYGAVTSAGIGTYTAGKVILALLAMAGVATEVTDIENIWQGGKFNADAYVNNVMIFNRDLGMALKSMIASAGSGATTLTMQRSIWNAWKRYCEQEYGTTNGTVTTAGTTQNNVKVWGTGSTFNIGYNISGYTPNTGSITIKVGNTPCILFACPMKYNGHIWRYLLYFVPITKIDSSKVGTFVNSFTYTYSGADIKAGYGTEYLNETTGYCLRYEIGHNTSIVINSFPLPAGTYITEAIEGYNTSSFNAIVAEKIQQYRTDGTLTQDSDVEVFPVEGIGNETATTAGQDVIGFDNTATQEEGQDVVIEGPLDVALPASATMEDLLKQLAEQQITYQEYVQALALQAVDTKTETKAQVEAKQQAITVNPASGAYTVSLKDLFPFCIPFDLYNIISAFNAEPVAPEVDITLPVSYNGSDFTWEDYTISLSAFDSVATVVRIFEYMLFIIGLMLITRKLIEG